MAFTFAKNVKRGGTPVPTGEIIYYENFQGFRPCDSLPFDLKVWLMERDPTVKNVFRAAREIKRVLPEGNLLTPARWEGFLTFLAFTKKPFYGKQVDEIDHRIVLQAWLGTPTLVKV